MPSSIAAAGHRLRLDALLQVLIKGLVSFAVHHRLLEAAELALDALVVLEAVLVVAELALVVALEDAGHGGRRRGGVGDGRGERGDGHLVHICLVVVLDNGVHQGVLLAAGAVHVLVGERVDADAGVAFCGDVLCLLRQRLRVLEGDELGGAAAQVDGVHGGVGVVADDRVRRRVLLDLHT
ncbi:hypothetical protein TYRP_021622 [Tyrophagus putrescentiae]|nr:hypothetical protein TYRP_021622 [Tyrophagus putrescentiae]